MIDVIIVDHGAQNVRLSDRLRITAVEATLSDAGYEVRTITVLNAHTGITQHKRNDEVMRDVPLPGQCAECFSEGFHAKGCSRT